MPLLPPAAGRTFARQSLAFMAAFARPRIADDTKASRTGPLIAYETLGAPAWSGRDYAAFAREGYMSNAIVHRCVRMVTEAAASVPLLLYSDGIEIEAHPFLDLIAQPALHTTREVRGLSHFLNQPKGRLFQYGCDADVGDPRCGIDLTLPAYRGLGTVVAVDSARRFTASGLGGYASGFFARGLLTFTSGAANGQAIEVNEHSLTGTTATVELWAPARLPLSAGQTFRITAGCDKHLATCQAKFSNVVNFRGFPHMPGNDFIMRGPR